MSDIGVWLKGLGLDQYAEPFAANDIDLEVLAHLSDDDLKELGLSLGHRRKLQAALADAIGAGATPIAADQITTPPADAATGAEAATGTEAERRQLTVMFCDLVGSTALSQSLDPEDLRALMTAYQDACTAAITRFDGFVARYMGDGLLAYFGYPHAHEDDAERAVNAGLAVIDAVAGLKKDIAVRVGIATGPVVVGDMIGEGASQEAAVTGETPNLAARLQEIAGPGTIVIAPSTHRLASNAFDCSRMQPRDLKGMAEPVRPWRVAGPRKVGTRFEAARGANLTDLVGREDEVDLLARRWEAAKSGEAQVVLLAGEAGIGKSRITQTLRERIAGEPYTRITFQCSPFFINRALHPIILHLERAAGFSPGDTEPTKIEKLEAMARLASDDLDAVLPWLAALLSVAADAGYAVPEVSPTLRRQRTLQALLAQLTGLAAQEPVLLILEDAHWIDNTTLEFMQLVVEQLETEPVLLIMTFRPEFSPGWVGEPNVTTLTLNRLGRWQSTAIVEAIAGGALPPATVARIVDRADGVPLYAEELAATVLESGKAESADAVPETLQDAMMARLDQMGAAKEVAQIAAVIGRQFGHGLLALVAEASEAELQSSLERLAASGLIQVRGTAPDASYLFRHALLRDTAYDSLLRGQRQELHGRIANAMEAHFADTAPPELLAHHLTEAGEAARAVAFWQDAGQQALGRAAGSEALAHLERALELVRSLPASPLRAGQEFEILMAMSPAIMTVKGFGADEIGAVHEQAFELADQAGNQDQSFRALFGSWMYEMQRPPMARAVRVANRLTAIAEETGERGHQLQALHSRWSMGLFLGEIEASHRQIKEGNRLYDIEQHGHHHTIFGGHDPGICASNFDSFCLWLLGFSDQAAEANERSIVLGGEVGHTFSVMISHTFAAMRKLFQDHWDAAAANAGLALEMSEEYGFATTSSSC